jgi:ABC-type lipoprotein export system ATPase subunit
VKQSPDFVLEIEDLTLQWPGESTPIFSQFGVRLKAGTMTALIGPSGTGKTSLLRLIAGMDFPVTGRISICNTNIIALSANELLKFRQKHLGFLFQDGILVKELSVVENIALKGIIAGGNPRSACQMAEKMLVEQEMIGLLNRKIDELSGGEKMRVALLRALYDYPTLLLADEPTGNLDPENSEKMIRLIAKAVKEQGVTALVATHDLSLLPLFHQQICL